MSRSNRINFDRHWPVAIVVILGLALTMAAATVTHREAQRAAFDVMDRRALFVAEAVRVSVQSVIDATSAAAGLFMASDNVTSVEFERFMLSVGQHPGTVGMAYIPVVAPETWDIFLAQARDSNPEFALFRFDQFGTHVRESGASTLPVLYSAMNSTADPHLEGFDAQSDPVWVELLERSSATRMSSVSRLTQLFGVSGDWGFVTAAPVIDHDSVIGYTASVARLDDLVEPELAESLSEVVTWSVRDVTRGGDRLTSPDALRRAESVHVGGRSWQVEVVPTDTARRELLKNGLEIALATGSFLTVLAAVTVHLAVRAIRSQREARDLRWLAEEKDEFLAALSHELRTPLTVVVGMADILEESTLDSNEEVREYVGLLRQEGIELSRLVEDLLLLGRLDAQVLPMRPEQVDVGWEVERIISEVDIRGHKEVITSGAGTAWADPLRLRHVIRHLYDNAVRHGGDRITVDIEDKPNEVVITFADNGAGIADHQLAGLFTSSKGAKDTPGGHATLGLGLRVSKRLVTVLGGDLSYRRDGDHTVFELRLPRIVPSSASEPFTTQSVDSRRAPKHTQSSRQEERP